jgi:predicted transcriptional regulator
MSTETKDVNFSFKTTKTLMERIDAMAKVTKRSKAFVIEDAITSYLKYNEWQIDSILRGLEDIKAGRVTPIEDFIAELEGELESCID